MYAVRASLAIAFDHCSKCFEVGLFPMASIVVYGATPTIVLRVGHMRFTHSMDGTISVPGGRDCVEMNKLITKMYLARFSSQALPVF